MNNHTLIEFDPLEAAHCPEHYVTDTGYIEAAGGGCLRFIRGIRHGSVFLPVYKVVMPYANLIIDLDQVAMAAAEALAQDKRMLARWN